MDCFYLHFVTDYPTADRIIHELLQPPGEQEMLEFYSRFELKESG